MKSPLLLVLMLLAGPSLVFGANLYRWVDAEGKVHYTDQPPPVSAKNVQQKDFGGNVIEGDQMPYATQMAAKRYPVVLYASNCGEACNLAREHLKKRGIPYTAKNPETPADSEALKKLIGGLEVPVLVVGNTSPQKGYEAGAWDAALDAAGYPKSAVVRSNGKADGTAKKPETKPAHPAAPQAKP